MKPSKTGQNRLLQAQATALKAERRYREYLEQKERSDWFFLTADDFRSLDGLGGVVKRLVMFAVDNYLKPALKKNQITYRAGLAIRDLYRRSRESKGIGS